MSEKLSRCRKELTAAIDRAMEDMSMPSPDSTVHDDVPVAELSTSPTEDLLNEKREATPPDLGCSQPSSPDSPAPEKENPQLRPNLVPLTVTSRTPCTKREPLISKENTWLHPPILVADRPFLVSLEDNERRREHASKTDERSMKSDVSVTARDASPDSSKDLADECADDPAIWSPEMLQQKSVLEKELQELSQLSSIPFSSDESSFLDLDVSSFRNVLDHSPEDEAIIETLLDMEEEYTANSSNLRQLH